MHTGSDPVGALDECPYQDPAIVHYRCCAGSTWAVSSLTQTSYNHLQPPNARVPDCGIPHFMPIEGRVGARSDHAGRVHVAFADGSARGVRDQIQNSVWKSIGTIAGGEVVAADAY
jgi:prepilin-type processing-associated H-X9-DG protein